MVSLKIHFITPSKVAIVFNFIRSIILNTLRTLSSIRKSSISLLLAVLILENTKIHICTLNGGNVTSHIKELVNECFSK